MSGRHNECPAITGAGTGAIRCGRAALVSLRFALSALSDAVDNRKLVVLVAERDRCVAHGVGRTIDRFDRVHEECPLGPDWVERGDLTDEADEGLARVQFLVDVGADKCQPRRRVWRAGAQADEWGRSRGGFMRACRDARPRMLRRGLRSLLL